MSTSAPPRPGRHIMRKPGDIHPPARHSADRYPLKDLLANGLTNVRGRSKATMQLMKYLGQSSFPGHNITEPNYTAQFTPSPFHQTVISRTTSQRGWRITNKNGELSFRQLSVLLLLFPAYPGLTLPPRKFCVFPQGGQKAYYQSFVTGTTVYQTSPFACVSDTTV